MSVSLPRADPGAPGTGPRKRDGLRVLGVFAHPDDETFGPGGTLARLAAEGADVHLWCATRGEAGTIGDSARMGRQRLARVRETELARACEVLGIRSHTLLDLPDGGLEELEEEALLRPLVQAIRRHRPALMVTFHPDGISGHSDHRTVTRCAARALEAAGREEVWPRLGPPHGPDRLWGYSVPESKGRRITYRRIWSVPDDEVDAVIDVRDYVGHKRRAVEAHASQKSFIDDLEAFLGGLDEYWAEEAFVLVAGRAPIPRDRRPLADLAEGLDR